RRPISESRFSMSERRIGLWLIGACGGVGTTAALGLAALKRGLTDTTSLVTALPLFSNVDLDAPAAFVVRGHDIRPSGLRQTVRERQQRAGVFDIGIVNGCLGDLETWEANVRPGTILNAGPTIGKLSELPEAQKADTPRAAIEQIKTDIQSFQTKQKLDQV